ncbi:hypothetical protein ACTFIW_007673 [Dictyostelium discoideum]
MINNTDFVFVVIDGIVVVYVGNILDEVDVGVGIVVVDSLSDSKGITKTYSGYSFLIQNEGKLLDVKKIDIIVLSTLSTTSIDIRKFISHSTLSAMASLLLYNNVPLNVVQKMGRRKSNDTVDTFYDKRIIGEKSGEFINDKEYELLDTIKFDK